jgi:hypothetical protein
MHLFSLASGALIVFDLLVRKREGNTLANPEDKKSHPGKVVTRWNVQPLREMDADVYPTPPTESLRASDPSNRPAQKTRRRRPARPSKS